MRQIVLDTETTGLEPAEGHRIIEIGCVELVNRRKTGKTFHKYINPQRSVGVDTLNITRITDEFLRDKPQFSEIVDEFLDFVKGAEVIAHNAGFDVGFINHELRLISKKAAPLESYVSVLDTLAIAREKFPGQRNTLDAICKRYKIDLTTRKLDGHGALLDAQLLTEAYLLMTGGQCNLFSEVDLENMNSEVSEAVSRNNKSRNTKGTTPVISADPDELTAHDAMLEVIKKHSGKTLWQN